MGTNETGHKPWYQSRTVLSGIVAVAAGVAGLAGVEFGAVDQEATIQALLALTSALAGLGAVYGRVKATKPIK